MPEVTTLCFHTRDAVERDDSSITFEMPHRQLRSTAVKVALASCEFPMVQWTIEEDWNRLYVCEGLRLDETSRYIDIVAKRPDETQPDRPLRILLPTHLNAVASAQRRGGKLVVECATPHGLFSEQTGRPLMPAFEELRLVGGSDGDLLIRAEQTTRISPTSFSVACVKGGESATYLCGSIIHSPQHLCELLTHAARGLADETFGLKVAFRYDATTDRVQLTAVADVPMTMVRILPSPLATRCGLSTHATRLETTSPTVMPSESTAFFDHVEMPPGFYAPCHRPMCTGQPLRFANEMERAVNRLYFPVGKPEEGFASPHLLVFADVAGRPHVVSIPCGRYTPQTICALLTERMSEEAGCSMEVSRTEDDRFVFECEDAFTLMFHHPLSVDASRFGFSAQPHVGLSTYVAPHPTRFAKSADGRRYVSNMVRVSELGSQKRFEIHAIPPPTMTAVVVERSDARTIEVSTFANRRAFASGLQAGDCVRLCPSTTPSVDNNGKEVDTPPVEADLSSAPTAVVLENRGLNVILSVPSLDGLDTVGSSLSLSPTAEPFSMCFDKPHSIPPHLMGFRRGAVQCGIDGSVRNAHGRLMSPFIAPNVHCLDHPDYIIMTFSEAAGATLEHTYDGITRDIFCKLSLYPLFREERMLPRDALLSEGNVSRFTIAFWNPDMKTPYRFHGAEFSFSLNFVHP